jgi:AcrR family transcriptional regulator
VSPSKRTRRLTQRERMLAAMGELAAGDGYDQASIARVIEHAGVSRPTFYEYFTDKDDCFLAALTHIQGQLHEQIREAIAENPPQHATPSAIQALITYADTQPQHARLVMNESMVCGWPALDTRDQAVADIATLIDQAQLQTPPHANTPDIASHLLIGGIQRLLARRLRHNEPNTPTLNDDLVRWVNSYRRPTHEHHWRTIEPIPFKRRPPKSAPLLAPPALPPGRPRVPKGEVRHAHRQRILLATAEVVATQGYAAATIATITERAGVDNRAFYNLFDDKQDAFAAAHELFFQHLMANTASAFFTGHSWPERLCGGALAFAGVLEQNPTIARVELIESHAAGSLAVQQLDSAILAYTIFLEEGYQQERDSKPPPRLALEAMIATSFELFYRQIRSSDKPRLVGLVPYAAHIALTPFLGAAESDLAISEHLATRP